MLCAFVAAAALASPIAHASFDARHSLMCTEEKGGLTCHALEVDGATSTVTVGSPLEVFEVFEEFETFFEVFEV